MRAPVSSSRDNPRPEAALGHGVTLRSIQAEGEDVPTDGWRPPHPNVIRSPVVTAYCRPWNWTGQAG